MLSQFRRFASYSILGSFASLIGILTVPYLTRALTPEEYGVIGLFMSVLYFLAPALSISSLGLVSINKVNLESKKYQNFADQYISLLLVSSLVVIGIFIFPSLFFEDYKIIIFCLPVVALFQSLSSMHSSELVQDKRAIIFGGYTILNASMLICITYASISIFKLGWQGRILALVASESIILMVRYRLTFKSLRNYQFRLSKVFLTEILKFGAPLLILLVAAWVFNEADRFIILSYLSLSDVGIYTASYSLGMAVNVLNNAMTNTIAPTIYGLLKEKRGKKTLRKLSFFYSIFILSISLVTALLFYNFGELFLGAGFEKGIWVTCIVLIAFGFNGMYRTVGLPLDYLKKNVLKTVNFSVAAIFNLVISIALFDAIGFLAPAIGTLIAFILLYLTTLFFNIKHTKHLNN